MSLKTHVASYNQAKRALGLGGKFGEAVAMVD